MNVDHRSEPITRGEWIALAAVAAVFSLIRLPLLADPALHLGWNSDAAIFGFMAKAIAAGHDLPIFFWGQSYMGPLTPIIAAAVGKGTGSVGPLALRLAAALETLFGILFYWAALRRAFDRTTAMVVALWLAIGPAYVLFFTIAPIGAEQMFFLSALLFWYAVRTGLVERQQWFVFGVFSGIGWWINQGIVFVVAAAFAIVILRSRAWAVAWPKAQLFDRMLLRADRLRWTTEETADGSRQSAVADRRILFLTLRIVNALLLLWIFDGALFTLRVPVPAFFLTEPLLEPLFVWLAFRLLLALTFNVDARAAVELLARKPRPWAVPLLLFLLGGAIGYLPVIAGGVEHRFPSTYGLSVPLLTLGGMATHVMTAVRSDFWNFIGATGGAIAILVAIALLPFFVLAICRHRPRIAGLLTLTPADYGARGMAAATMLLCIVFYIGSSRAHPGSVRYIVSALPMLYAFAAREMFRSRTEGLALGVILSRRSRGEGGAGGAAERGEGPPATSARPGRWLLGVIPAAAVAIALAIPRMNQTRAVADGRGEYYSGLPGGFDPRPVLQTIERQGYTICYADYWIAYKLQWVSDERIRFVPFHSYDRTPAESRALDAAPGPKCFVDASGAVRRFNHADFDESTMNAARERLRKLRAAQE